MKKKTKKSVQYSLLYGASRRKAKKLAISMERVPARQLASFIHVVMASIKKGPDKVKGRSNKRLSAFNYLIQSDFSIEYKEPEYKKCSEKPLHSTH